MKPGRELDALVAEKVMGETVVRTTWGKSKQYGCYSLGEPNWYDDAGASVLSNPVPSYSENIADAWLVVEKLFALGWDVELQGFENKDGLLEWRASVRSILQQELGAMEFHRSASHAISIAALRALGVEV